MNVEVQLECVFVSILFIENYFIIKLWAIFCTNIDVLLGFSHGSVVKNPPANAGDAASIPGSKIPWRREWLLSLVFLPAEFPWTEKPGQTTVHGVVKSWTQMSD